MQEALMLAPMGSGPVMTGLDGCVRYINSKGHWY